MKRQWTEEELEQRIADRLGERQRKLQRMEELEYPKRIRLWKPTATFLALAACLALAVYISPLSSGSAGDEGLEEAARGCGINMSSLIEEGRYEEALWKVDSAMQVSERTVSELKDEAFDDEAEYLLESEEQNLEHLQALKEEILKKMKE